MIGMQPGSTTPEARAEWERIVSETGVRLDISHVHGTGPGGMLTPTDIRTAEAAHRAQHDASLPNPVVTVSGIDPRFLRDLPSVIQPAVMAAPTMAIAEGLVARYRHLSDIEATILLQNDPTVPQRFGGATVEANACDAWTELSA